MCAVALGVLLATSTLLAQQPAARRAGAKTETRTAVDGARKADEEAIRQLAVAYVKSYNAREPKTIAGLFTPDGEIVDDQGHSIQGRGAIEKVFAAVFESFPQARTAIEIKSLRFLGANLAIEEGTARVTLVPGEPADANDYSVVHVKQDGKWLMASAHDLPTTSAPPGEHLEQLAWLIGDWVDEGPQSLVHTSYRWDENHNFILSDFSIHITGREVMNGTQRIGWDPLSGVLRSWIFDSEGGFAEGTYSRQGNQWIVELTGVTRDGKQASATNTITRVGGDRMTWQSRDRMVGGEPEPDTGQITAVRKPPKPM
jgi:uncharacterized protein (TIGR02246 family)